MKDLKNDILAHVQACLCAPFAVFPAVFSYYYVSSVLVFQNAHQIDSVGWLVALFGYLIGLIITIAYGLPVVLTLIKKKKLSLTNVFLFSLIPPSLYGLVFYSTYQMLFVFIPCSLSVACAYFFLYRLSANGIQQGV
jgi:hypothetical protein